MPIKIIQASAILAASVYGPGYTGQPQGMALNANTPLKRPNAPGVAPMHTTLSALTVVIYYRYYRLANLCQYLTSRGLQNLYNMKSQIEGLNTTPAVFNRFHLSKFQKLLASLKRAFDAFGKSEAVIVSALAFVLSDDVKECYIAHMLPGVAHRNVLATI